MGAKHRIKIIGCPYGLDKEEPELPDVPCSYPCDWRVNSEEFMNCAWVVFDDGPDKIKISLREMGKMLDMTHESVRSILEEAKNKLPKTEEEMEKLFGKVKNSDIRRTSNKKVNGKLKLLKKLLED